MGSATDTLAQTYLTEREQKVHLIETIAATAEDEGRDLYPTDLETITRAKERIAVLDTQINAVADSLELAESVRTRVRALDPAILGREVMYRTAGDYMWDALHKHQDEAAAARFSRFHKRAAEHLGLDKANTIATAGGFNGLVVVSNVGAVLDPNPSGRPLLTALGARPVPGSQFNRPRIVDPSFKSGGVAVQTQEKAELVSKTWDIVSETLTMEVVGGYINVSELLLEMLSSSLDMVVSHMNARLEYASEAAAVAELDKTTETVALAADADSAAVMAALGTAAATVFTNTGRLPAWLAMGPAAYGRLIGLTDLAGRPMFPALNPVNAMGSLSPDAFPTSINGMRAVVTHAITSPDMYVGNSFGLEVYERRFPVLQAIEPSVFGRQISVQTGLAFYRPITAEAGPGGTPAEERNGVVKIDWA